MKSGELACLVGLPPPWDRHRHGGRRPWCSRFESKKSVHPRPCTRIGAAPGRHRETSKGRNLPPNSRGDFPRLGGGRGDARKGSTRRRRSPRTRRTCSRRTWSRWRRGRVAGRRRSERVVTATRSFHGPPREQMGDVLDMARRPLTHPIASQDLARGSFWDGWRDDHDAKARAQLSRHQNAGTIPTAALYGGPNCPTAGGSASLSSKRRGLRGPAGKPPSCRRPP